MNPSHFPMATPDFDALLAQLRLSPEVERALKTAHHRELTALATKKEEELTILASKKDEEIAAHVELGYMKDETINTMQRKIQTIECARVASAFSSRALVARPCRRACQTTCGYLD